MPNSAAHQAEPFASIQVLRGLAALYVVLYHQLGGTAAFPLVRGGYVGVDVFFIVSGFIIYEATRSPSPAGAFYIKRLFRLLPPLWVATIGAALIAVAAPSWPDVAKSVLLIPLTNSGPPFFGGGILGIAWTLSYELAFYSLFFLVLLIPGGHAWRGLSVSVLIVALCAGLQVAGHGSVLLDAHWPPPLPIDGGQILSLLANPLMIEFVVGIALCAAYPMIARIAEHRRIHNALIIALVPVLFIGIDAPQLYNHGLPGKGAVAVLIAFYFLLLEAGRRRGRFRFLDKGGFLYGLGEISYSLYLVHLVAAPLLRTYLPGVNIVFMAIPEWSAYLLNLALILATAFVFNRVVERPSQRAGRFAASRIERLRRVPAAADAVRDHSVATTGQQIVAGARRASVRDVHDTAILNG